MATKWVGGRLRVAVLTAVFGVVVSGPGLGLVGGTAPAALAASCTPPPTDTTGPGTPSDYALSGTVVSTADSAPLEDVRIVVEAATGAFIGSTTTAPDGSWTVPVDAGTYRIGIVPPAPYQTGYLAGTDVVLNSTTADPVEVTTAPVADLDVALPIAQVFTVSGTVTAAARSPAEGVTIAAQGLHIWPDAPDCVTTDADGNFQLEAPAGTYALGILPTPASPGGFYGLSGPGNFVPWLAGATPIVLDASSTAHITLPATVTLSGTVTDANAVPIDGILVQACLAADPETCPSGLVTAGGSFSLTRVVPGFEYLLRADPQDGARFRGGYVDTAGMVVPTIADAYSRLITVADPGIAIVMTENPAVTGRVTDDAGAGLADVGVQLCSEAGVCGSGTTGVDGTFRVHVPAGEYRAFFYDTADPSDRVAVYLGPAGATMSASAARLVTVTTADEPVGDVVLPNGYRVAGRSAPLTGVDLCLPDLECVAGTSTAQDGSFTLGPVLPGSYLLGGFTDLGDRVWYVEGGPATADPDQSTPVVVTGDPSELLFDLPVGTLTSEGTQVPVAPSVPGEFDGLVSLTFPEVTGSGRTTLETYPYESEGDGSDLPTGFVVNGSAIVFDIRTSALYAPPVEVCIAYDSLAITGTPSLLHKAAADGVFEDITTSVANGLVCGLATSFSPFMVLERPTGFRMFAPPVDASPVVNVAKAGSAVPVVFDMDGDAGLEIFEPGFPRSLGDQCDGSDPTDSLETTTRNASGLTFDSATGLYTYVWKTEKAWAGTCRTLVLQFNDGSSATAQFRFKR